VIIYIALLFVDVLLVLISRDVTKTSGDEACMWRAAARQPKGSKHGGEVLSVSVLNCKVLFFFPPLTLIAVQLKLPQFKYFWEHIELMGDAVRQHFAEISRHKNSLSR